MRPVCLEWDKQGNILSKRHDQRGKGCEGQSA